MDMAFFKVNGPAFTQSKVDKRFCVFFAPKVFVHIQ